MATSPHTKNTRTKLELAVSPEVGTRASISKATHQVALTQEANSELYALLPRPKVIPDLEAGAPSRSSIEKRSCKSSKCRAMACITKVDHNTRAHSNSGNKTCGKTAALESARVLTMAHREC